MDRETLKTIAEQMMQKPKGLLAMDESSPTCAKRFSALNIPETEENRIRYRELIVTTPKLSEYISGAILFDGTFHQKMSSFPKIFFAKKNAFSRPTKIFACP